MIADDSLLMHASELIGAYRQAGLRLVLAESCTGGLIAATLTEIAGSSEVIERGFVTYSNEAKIEQLGVPSVLIDKHGAVSPHVARAMAEGALEQSRADVAIAVTGIAGPGGATPAKPVGLVYLAAERRGREPLLERHVFTGDRRAIRLAAVATAFDLLDRQLGD